MQAGMQLHGFGINSGFTQHPGFAIEEFGGRDFQRIVSIMYDVQRDEQGSR